jgi:hypothetical protein
MPQLFRKSTTSNTSIEDIEKKTWQYIWFVIMFGIALVLIVSLCCPKDADCNSFIKALSTFGRGLLIGGAAFACGGFGGFIFGIPSMVQNEETQKQIRLKYNDNLIQISDWLTKIIVGIGLIELNKIPGKISDMGDSLKLNFGQVEWGKIASLAIVFYFFLFGFLIVYFWTRTDFTKIIAKTSDEIDKWKQVQDTIEKQSKKINTLLDSEDEKRTKELIEESAVAMDASALGFSKTDDSPALKTALEELKEKVKQVLKNKPIRVKDDLQKNRWGGKAENNGKQIEATVTQSDGTSFYDILITISDKLKTSDVPVAIFVHDSFRFPDDVIYVKPDSNGVSQITLSAYEAFTVGALFADNTELELDLNEQKGYPEGFYWGKNNANTLV